MMIVLQTCTHYLPKPAHVAGHLYSHVWDHVTNWSSSLLHHDSGFLWHYLVKELLVNLLPVYYLLYSVKNICLHMFVP